MKKIVRHAWICLWLLLCPFLGLAPEPVQAEGTIPLSVPLAKTEPAHEICHEIYYVLSNKELGSIVAGTLVSGPRYAAIPRNHFPERIILWDENVSQSNARSLTHTINLRN